MSTSGLTSALAPSGGSTASFLSRIDFAEALEGDRLIDTLFVAVLVLVGLIAACLAWRRSVRD